MPAPGPLAGLTIVDLTRVLSGPYCTMLLADMGARVIKVEQPGRGDDTRAWGPPFVGAESAYFLSINRNKESVTLDFKTAEGRAHSGSADRHAADVVVENFRPARWRGWGSTTRRWLSSTRASCSARFPASVRTARVGTSRDTTRSSRRKAD